MASNGEDAGSGLGAKRTLEESTLDPARADVTTTQGIESADASKRVRRSRWGTGAVNEEASGATGPLQTMEQPSSVSSTATSGDTLVVSKPDLSAGSVTASAISASAASAPKPTAAASARLSALAEIQAKLAKAKEERAAKLAQSLVAGASIATSAPTATASSTAAPVAVAVQQPTESRAAPAAPSSTIEATPESKETKAPTLTLAERLKQQIEREREIRERFFDKSLKLPPPERKKRELVFLEPGTFTRRAEAMRAKQLAEELRGRRYAREISARDAAVVVDFKQLPGATVNTADTVEWWDRAILGLSPDADATYSDCPLDESGQFVIDESKITSLIHHPRKLLPAIIEPYTPPRLNMLTKAEAKKKRKRERAERIREQHDWIRAGLLPPPPPKLRLSTLMHTMGDALITDPTGIVAQAKAQLEERIRKHEEANRARMLTPEQRREKRLRKRTEDTSYRVCVAVYRAGDMSEYIRRERIQRQVRRYMLTGIAVLHPDCNLIVLEGGPKGLAKVHRYLTKAIRWSQKSGRAGDEEPESDSDEDEDDEDEMGDEARAGGAKNVQGSKSVMESQLGKTIHKSCVLVWKGEVVRRNFDNFTFETGITHHSARQIVERRGVPHYWDAALTYSVPRVL